MRQTLLATRPVAPFPMSKYAPPAGLAVEAADVEDALAEEPPLMRGPMMPPPSPRPSSPGANREFHLSPARIEPRPQRLPLNSALAPYAPVVPSSLPSHLPVMTGQAAIEASSELPLDLQPLGQVQESFIVAVNSAGLWIVDQHAAHERVLFDRHVRRRQEQKVEVQRLLMPMVIELAPRQLVIYEKIAEELAANGFEVEPMGPKSVAIQAVPGGIAAGDAEQLLTEILDGLDRENAAISIDTLQAKIAASTACHAAIKVNMPLDQTKMEWLLAALAKTDCPMSCPHGRPVVLRFSLKEIEKAFHRI